MKVTEFDKSKWDAGLDTWKSILEYRKKNKNPSKSQLKYFDLYIEYLERLKYARDHDGFIVAHATSVPVEIFYAMDMTPVLLVGTCFAISQCIKGHAQAMSAAKEFGLAEETCSAHKGIVAHCVQGWLPKPSVFVDVGAGCDTFSNSMKIAAELYDTPYYHVDVPYYGNERSIKYLEDQFKDLIKFLESISGRKMDWDRLRGSIEYSKEMLRLWREVYELRKAVPSPMDNRRAWETNWINWFFMGTPEGVSYWQTLRDELKERVEKGVGAYPKVNEQFRILDLLMAPAFDLRILEWMQEKYGANIVLEIIIYYQMNLELDEGNPLKIMAKRWFSGTLWNMIHGPTENWVDEAVKQAKLLNIDAAIFWDQNACRQAGAIKMIQNALSERAGIPTVRVNVDITDPAFVSSDEVKAQLSEFFEILKERKGAIDIRR